MAVLIVFTIVIYLGSLVSILVLKEVNRRRFKQELDIGNWRVGGSLLWAWGSLEDCFQVLEQYGNLKIGGIVRQPKPHLIRLFNPLKVMAVIAIITYQNRPRSIWPGLNCPSTPNCSNYAIGTMQRYSFFGALIRSANRIRYCNGSNGGITFNEFHLIDRDQ